MSDVLLFNLLSPFVLAFLLGAIARLAGSDMRIPEGAQTALALFLLLALGLHGGVALRAAEWSRLLPALGATLLVGVVTPLTSYAALRRLRFSGVDAAGIAAHYGSVSAVTFIAAQQFVSAQGHAAESYMTTLLTVLEIPGIAVALVIGTLFAAGGTRERNSATSTRDVADALARVLRSKSMVLLCGGLAIGYVSGPPGWDAVGAVFDTKGAMFKAALTFFLLQLGIDAAGRAADLRAAGVRLVAFGTMAPTAHGLLGTALASAAGMSIGGSAVLGAMAASASYIAAPPAVRSALPQANGSYAMAAALAVTFPWNLAIGIPLYYGFARWLQP